jgi:hypothetical protein
MTDPARQPPQEYIITEALVKDIYAAIRDMDYPQTAESTASALRSRPAPASPIDGRLSVGEILEAIAAIRYRPPSLEPMLGSTDLLFLANDEWKRRQERKHLHDNTAWVSGFVGGFLTDKKWARKYVDKLRHTTGGEQE